ncbi:MAG: amino acid racemase [Pseudomonadales bacterium]|nr:amino acid racemase [Pseudomonadales bacterium]
MKKIGLVGGLTWISTLEYYREINQSVGTHLGKHHSASVLIESLDRQVFLDAATKDPSEKSCADLIVEAFQTLKLGGAELFAVCANGIHQFAPIIREETGISLESIATATAKHAKSLGLVNVGLLGVERTMEGTFFHEALRAQGIETTIPNKADRSLVHTRIVEELVIGEFNDRTRLDFEQVSRDLQRDGAEAIVMGCTEIPLMFPKGAIGDILALSTTKIHCDAIVNAAL